MTGDRKKLVAPIIVTVLLVLYFIAYFGFLIALVSGVWRVVLAVIPLALAAVTIYVCVERINEIRSGEEDDLSQY